MSLLILLTWSMIIKPLRKNTLNGRRKFKNSILQTNFWKDKDINIQLIGWNLKSYDLMVKFEANLHKKNFTT